MFSPTSFWSIFCSTLVVKCWSISMISFIFAYKSSFFSGITLNMIHFMKSGLRKNDQRNEWQCLSHFVIVVLKNVVVDFIVFIVSVRTSSSWKIIWRKTGVECIWIFARSSTKQIEGFVFKILPKLFLQFTIHINDEVRSCQLYIYMYIWLCNMHLKSRQAKMFVQYDFVIVIPIFIFYIYILFNVPS